MRSTPSPPSAGDSRPRACEVHEKKGCRNGRIPMAPIVHVIKRAIDLTFRSTSAQRCWPILIGLLSE